MASLSFFTSPLSPELCYSTSSLSSVPFSLRKHLTLPSRSFNPRFPNHALSSTFPGHSVGDDLPSDYDEHVPMRDPSNRRRAGILLHPTSFRGPYGIGDLSEEAFRFIDWLHEAGCSVWQVLPLVPPGRKANEEGSPYSGQDANCGNTLLISLEELVKDGLLKENELPEPVVSDRVNFAVVAELKDPLIAKNYLCASETGMAITQLR